MNDKNDINIISFLKFGDKKDIYDLYENGTIYFNTINFFQNLEEQGLRGDNYEGTTKITNYHEYDNFSVQIKLHDSDKTFDMKPSKLHLREYLKDIKGNIFSLYALKTPDILDINNFSIDKRVVNFGSHFVIIRDLRRFIAKITSELKRKKISHKFGLVHYYDRNKINQAIGLFDKPDEFEYQREFRIALYRKEQNPFIIKIGSIKDYSMMFESVAINDIKFEFKK